MLHKALALSIAFLLLAGWSASSCGALSSEGGRTADSNNSIATAVNITSGVPISEGVARNDDRYDYFKIDALSGQTIRASVSWTTASADIRLDIRNSGDGSVLHLGEAARAQGSVTTVGDTAMIAVNGSYYVRINCDNNGGASNYVLNVTVDYPIVINIWAQASGNINSQTDNRTFWYRVWLNGTTGGQAETAYIDMSKTNSGARIGKRLYDILFSQSMHEYNASSSGNARTNLSWTASYTGWYYYRLYAVTNQGNPSISDFTLYTGKFLAAADADNDPLNATSAPRSAHLNSTLDKAFDHYDWYAYKVVAGDSVILNVSRTSSSAYFNVTVYGSNLGIIAGGESTGGWGSRYYINITLLTATIDDTYLVVVMLHGTYNNGLTEDPASMSYWLNFSSPNHPPAIKAFFNPIRVNEDERAKTDIFNHFFDPDGDKLTFKVTAPHVLGSFNNTTNDFEIYGPPNWYGVESATIIATDSLGAWVTTPVNVTVLSMEDPPLLNKTLPNITMPQNGTDSTLDLTRYFIDNDTPYGDKLIWGVSGNGSLQVSITPAGKVTLTAPINFWGFVNLTFSATDNVPLTATGICHVTVYHVNQAPQVKALPPEITVDEDDSVTMDFSPVFWDPDGDPITVLAGGNSQIDVIQQNGTLNLTFRPRPDASGFFESIRLTAKDDKGFGENYVTMKVTVNPVNDAPRITKATPVGDVTINENQSVEFNVSAYDPESGASVNFAWYLDGQPVLLGITNYVYRTDHTSAGNHTVMVTVGDGELFTTMIWNVTVNNVNREPADLKILSPKPGEVLKEGSPMVLDGIAVDLDGDVLEYTWFEGAKELGKGRNLTVALPPGPHAVVMQVSDGRALVKSKPMSFSVKANAPPQLYSLDPSNGAKFDKGAKILFKAEAGDTDNDTLSFCWTENGKVLSNSPSFYKSDLSAGSHQIQLTISDGMIATNTTLTLTVNPAPAGGIGSEVFVMMAVAIIAVLAVVIVVLLMRRRKPDIVVAEATRVDGDEAEEAEEKY